MRKSRLIKVRGQEGMASIVVVSVLIVILTLISIGFARLINRSVNNAANRQYSAMATYAAQSAINDVAAYVKQYVINNGSTTYLPKSTKCNGAGSLIGSSSSPGPFYNDSNLSGDSGTRYTCLLLNPTPADLVYTQVTNLKSQVVKVNTSAAAGALDRLMISWQPSDSQITGYPTSLGNLYNETTWNGTSGICKDASSVNASCFPILRVSIFPISNGESINGTTLQSQSKTVFLYPQPPSGNVKSFSYGDNVNFQDGSIIGVPCTQSIGVNTFTPSTNSDYKCNVIISSLTTAIAPAATDAVYLRLTPLYNQADIKIQANDKFGDNLTFINDQAVVDATALTGGVSKRLQARIDTSSLSSTSSGIDTNISSSSDDIPQQSLRTAVALCKREIQDTPGNGFNKFVSFDLPDNVCHITGGTTVTDYVPTLTFKIGGQDWNGGGYSGVTRDSEDVTPPSSSYKGTLYLPISGSATLSWNTKDAEYCTGSGGSGGDGWAGDKTGLMTFTGSPTVLGSGSQAMNNITSVTEYDLVCTRPLASAPTPTKKVYAWPTPVVYFNNTSVTAGQSYSLSWYTRNSTSCSASGSWSGSKSSSVAGGTFSQNQGTWPWWDNGSHTYNLTCSDPSGRSTTAQITLSASSSNNCSGGSSCSGNVNPPPCHASATVNDNGDGTAYPSWNGYCDGVPIGNTFFSLSSSNTPSWNISGYRDTSSGGVGNAANATWLQVGPGWHCVGLETGLDFWGWQKDSGEDCKNIVVPPVVADIFSVGDLIWWNGPTGGCTNVPDGAGHTWYICSILLKVHQNGTDGSQLHCQLLINGAGKGSWTGNAGDSSLQCPNGWPWVLQAGWYGNCIDGPSPGPNETVEWKAWSDRGGTSYDNSITRSPSWPPTCP